MIRLPAFLWSGCWHEWELRRTVTYYGDGFGHMTKLPTGFGRECRCAKCGAWKVFRT